MTLVAGTRLGPYEVVSPLGAGGMGEVYRARDTRLDRTVAIKVLNSSLDATPDLKARFEREARAISQLNHPNICTLHDIGHDNGTDYLVMEFIDGESLGTRLKNGPLPADQLLKIAIEVAEPFPGGGPKWQVSTTGGGSPHWRGDGKELFFISDHMMAVDVTLDGATPRLGTPKPLFQTTAAVSGPNGPFDVTRDGKKFLVHSMSLQMNDTPLTLVTNWTAELKR